MKQVVVNGRRTCLRCHPHLLTAIKPQGAQEVKKEEVPLAHIAAKVKIFGGIAAIELTHTYLNKSKHLLETTFSFPVDPSMTVTKLLIQTEEKEFTAKLMPKEKAAEEYEDAMAAGDTAYKLDYDQQEILTMKIGNFEPDKRITVKIGILHKLDVSDKSWTLRLSPTFTPYFSSQEENPQSIESPISFVPAKSLPYQWEVEVEILTQGTIERLVCPSHKLEFTYGRERKYAHVKTQKKEAPNTDFVLLYRASEISAPQIYLQESEEYKNEVVALVSFFPDFCPPEKDEEEKEEKKVDQQVDKIYENEEEEEQLEGAGEFVFVIDRSGSMSGSRVKMALEAAQLFLRSLPQNSKFNIVSFGSEYEKIFKTSVKYSEKNLEKAVAELHTFSADMGGTQIYSPLKYIFSRDYDPRFPLNVFLLTDGGVASPAQVVSLIKANADRARCHTFGIGNGVSVELVKRAALAGNGSYQFIVNKEDNMNAKVVKSLSKAVKPALSGLRAEWTASMDILLQGREKLHNVFHYEPFTMGAIIKTGEKKEGELTITGFQTKTGREVSFRIDLGNALVLPKGEDLFQLCAKECISELEETKEKKKGSPSVEEISLKYHVLSGQTSFIAVEKLDKKAKGRAQPVTIPVALVKQSDTPMRGRSRAVKSKTSSVQSRSRSSFATKMKKCKSRSITPSLGVRGGRGGSGGMFLAKKSPTECKDRYKRERSRSRERVSKKELKSGSELRQLISLQGINGAWSLNAALISIVKSSPLKVALAPPSKFAVSLSQDLREKLWATVIALKLLRAVFKAEQEEWKRIEIKGIKFLKQHNIDPKQDYEH